MREVEFLPGWYPVLRRRRALAVTQAWATAVIMGALCLFGVAEHHRVMAHESHSAQLTDEMAQTRRDLKLLDEQLSLKKQLQQQAVILSKVGLQVDATRLLGELANTMGRDMFLVELNIDTQEVVKPLETAVANNLRSRAAMSSANEGDNDICDRRLKVKMVCIAPSDVEVANFLAGLTNKSFLDEVAMTYARDRVQGGRVMREIEVTFLINLNSPATE